MLVREYKRDIENWDLPEIGYRTFYRGGCPSLAVPAIAGLALFILYSLMKVGII